MLVSVELGRSNRGHGRFLLWSEAEDGNFYI